MLQTLFISWDKLTWKIPHQFKPPILDEGSIKEAALIGPEGPLKSDKISIKIFSVRENTKVPRHSEDATEVIQLLQGSTIQIGYAVDDWLDTSKYHLFPATFPKIMKVCFYHRYLLLIFYEPTVFCHL